MPDLELSEKEKFKKLHKEIGPNLREGVMYYIVSSSWLNAYESFINYEYQEVDSI